MGIRVEQFSGRRLKEIRQRAGISRTALAFHCGRSADTVAQWEIGRAKPRPEVLRTIADAVGCEIDDLLTDDDPAAGDGAVA